MVIDFGAVARLPDGLPRPLSEMVRLALDNRSDDLLALLRREGFVRAGSTLGAAEAEAYLSPFTEAAGEPRPSGSTVAGCRARPNASAICAAPSSTPDAS